MRALVTGHLGYIGPHVVELLKEAGHFVRGVDLNLYEGSQFSELTMPDESVVSDVFDLTESDLEGFDAVIHLAGVSNDPIGAFVPELTWRINLEGTMHLARMAKAAGVPRFLFSSSCSIYGKSGDKVLNEDDEVAPVTDYGRTKIEAERQLAEMADESFSPTYLRNATAYGTSPRLRLDLVVNNLCAWAFATNEIRIISDGSPWRPLVHCRDIARAFVYLAAAPREKVHNQAFNIGTSAENYQVRDLVDMVLEVNPQYTAVYTGEGSPDSRDYRVDFSKFAKAFPDFGFAYTVRDGVRELMAGFAAYGMTEDQIDGPRFIRLKSLKDRVGELADGVVQLR
jgi:nucleoside-diphosphate-sugar epimerase